MVNRLTRKNNITNDVLNNNFHKVPQSSINKQNNIQISIFKSQYSTEQYSAEQYPIEQ